MWKQLETNHLYTPDTNAKYGINFTFIPEECVNVYIPFHYFPYPILLRNKDGKQLMWNSEFMQFRYVTSDFTEYLTWLDLSQSWEIFE